MKKFIATPVAGAIAASSYYFGNGFITGDSSLDLNVSSFNFDNTSASFSSISEIAARDIVFFYLNKNKLNWKEFTISKPDHELLKNIQDSVVYYKISYGKDFRTIMIYKTKNPDSKCFFTWSSVLSDTKKFTVSNIETFVKDELKETTMCSKLIFDNMSWSVNAT